MPRRPRKDALTLPTPEEIAVGIAQAGHNQGPPIEDLMALGEVNMLKEARKAAVRHLLTRLQEGDISAPELAVLRNLLRDNGMILIQDAEEGAPANPTGFHLPDLDADELDPEE